jgi:hypothetical protein
MFIATVHVTNNKPNGKNPISTTAWIHLDKYVAIQSALKYAESQRANGYQVQVLVGELTAEAKAPQPTYELLPLDPATLK